MKTLKDKCNTKEILIDGFNLIYKYPDLQSCMHRGDLQSAMKGLISIVAKFAKAKKKNITIVFDGKKEAGNEIKSEKSSGLKIIYSHDQIADKIILQTIKKSKTPKNITVVTSDKEILFVLNRYQTPAFRSEDFQYFMEKELSTSPENTESIPPEKSSNVELSEDEVNFWEKLFTSRKN